MESIQIQGCIENYSLCVIYCQTHGSDEANDLLTKNWIGFTGTHYHSIDIRSFHLAATGF